MYTNGACGDGAVEPRWFRAKNFLVQAKRKKKQTRVHNKERLDLNI